MDTYTKGGTAWLRYAAILFILFTLVPALPAQEIIEETVTVSEPALDSGNTAWILTSSLLVLLMSIPGIALFYGGLVRQKNVLSVIMQTLFIVGLLSAIAGHSTRVSPSRVTPWHASWEGSIRHSCTESPSIH